MIGLLVMEATPYPRDLLRVQADWSRTYETLANSTGGFGVTALRRRLLHLSVQILWHPRWAAQENSPAARIELRRQARAMESRSARAG
jgi:hypothetical protein